MVQPTPDLIMPGSFLESDHITLNFEILAKSFLWNQIRILIYTFIYYAKRGISKEQIVSLLQTPMQESNKEDLIYFDNGKRYMKLMAPPDGLYLTDIKYDPKHFII